MLFYFSAIPEPLTPLEPTPDRNKCKVGTILLTIPLEIRMHIYSYVLRSHEIYHPNLLSPTTISPPAPSQFEKLQYTTFIFAASQHDNGTGCLNGNSESQPILGTYDIALQKTQILNIGHPIGDPMIMTTTTSALCHGIQGKMPTGLLVSCHQIYEEVRLLPFHTNAFVFVNWFWSGVYAARQFTRGLKTWQREAVRWTSLEVLARDLRTGGMDSIGGGIGGLASMSLDGRGKGSGEWIDLCRLWERVLGLKLSIKGSLNAIVDGSINISGNEGCEGNHLLNANYDWVQGGVLHLKSLRFLELEIEDETIDRETKLAFCRDLCRMLSEKRDREDGWRADLKVVLVEKFKVEAAKPNFKWYGGFPGDDD
ncbi:hypothetical protein B0O99DRAFT_687443 [Bisporella sp. PMI_857]|nr:hypothetical protein B0O99DRAFT_687443 [Bisporella sp. PMI_857]